MLLLARHLLHAAVASWRWRSCTTFTHIGDVTQQVVCLGMFEMSAEHTGITLKVSSQKPKFTKRSLHSQSRLLCSSCCMGQGCEYSWIWAIGDQTRPVELGVQYILKGGAPKTQEYKLSRRQAPKEDRACWGATSRVWVGLVDLVNAVSNLRWFSSCV